MQKDDIQEAQELLLARVRDLKPTGKKSFERFVRAIFDKFLNSKFHIVQSGFQEGSDIRSNPNNESNVYIECKRHTTKAPRLAELNSKLASAVNSKIPVDSWILVSTIEIDASKRTELHNFGNRLGVGVCIIDINSNHSELGDLLSIVASAPDVCQVFLDVDSKLDNSIQTITNHRDFESSLRLLKQHIQRSSLIYDNTCLMCQGWLADAQISVRNAKSRLGGYHNLNDPDEMVIPRNSLLSLIDTWYKQSDSLLAILGDEGMGKSWVVLDWINKFCRQSEKSILPLFVPAKSIEEDVRSTIVSSIVKIQEQVLQTSESDKQFWKRKLTRWEKFHDSSTSILLIIDGLNQNIHFREWASWLQPLLEERLHTMYRVIITCQPYWWTKQLLQMQSLEPRPLELQVEGFKETELQAMLAHASIPPSEFSKPVLRLIKSPRLARLAIKHHKNLREKGDITEASLVFEDLKQTYAIRYKESGLTDSEFCEVICLLGQKIKDDYTKILTSGEITKILRTKIQESGDRLEAAINDLSSGSWLKTIKNPSKFQLVQEKVSIMMGLTLVGELAECNIDDAALVISQFLDPLKSHSLGAQILLAALSFSLVDTDFSAGGKSAILHNLLQHQNFSQQEFEELWRIVGLDASLFLDYAQHTWLKANTGHFQDEVLIKTFARCAPYTNVLQALTVRLTDWLSVVWTQTDVKNEERSNLSSELNVEIRFDNNSGWSWLSYRALQILANLPDDSIQRPLLAWSLSRATMQEKHHADIVEWMLRWKTSRTNTSYDVIQNARSLLTSNGTVLTRRAARYLSAISSHSQRSRKPFVIDEPSDRQTYKAFGNTVRLDLVIRNMLKNKSWIGKELAKNPISTLNRRISNTSQLDDTVFDLILRNLECLLFILKERSREKVYSELELRLKDPRLTSEEDRQTVSRLKIAKHIFDLYSAPSLEQAQLRLATGFQLRSRYPLNSFDNLRRLYRPSRFVQSNNTKINSASPQGLLCWLDYHRFSRHPSDISKMSAARDLVVHDDLEVRLRSLVIAVNSDDLDAINEFLGSKFAHEVPNERSYQDPRYKSIYELARSRAVLKQCNYSLDAALRKEIRHDAICEIVERRPTESLVLQEYNKYLKQQFYVLETRASHSWDNYIFDQSNAISHLLRFDKSMVMEWLVPWIDREHDFSILDPICMGESPVYRMMEEFVEVDPNVSLDMYEKLCAALEQSLFSSHSIKYFPFKRFKLSKRCIELRKCVLDKLNYDKDILDLTYYVFEFGDTDWLYNIIYEFVNTSSVWYLALGYTLLGFCDVSTEADQLWDQCKARPPIDKWLLHVFNKSLDSYSQNRLCRESLTKFWTTRDRLVAFRCLRYIEEFGDTRIKLWINPLSPENLAEFHDGLYYEKNVACGYLVDRINKDANNKDRKLKDVLFHTRIGPSFMPPWS